MRRFLQSNRGSVGFRKPDDDELTPKWNEMMGKANAEAHVQSMDLATAQLKDWKEKLDVQCKQVRCGSTQKSSKKIPKKLKTKK